jgi:hypothetical protein
MTASMFSPEQASDHGTMTCPHWSPPSPGTARRDDHERMARMERRQSSDHQGSSRKYNPAAAAIRSRIPNGVIEPPPAWR